MLTAFCHNDDQEFVSVDAGRLKVASSESASGSCQSQLLDLMVRWIGKNRIKAASTNSFGANFLHNNMETWQFRSPNCGDMHPEATTSGGRSFDKNRKTFEEKSLK